MKTQKKLKRKGIICLAISLAFMLIGSFTNYQGRLSTSEEERHKKFQSDFLKKEQTFHQLFDKLTASSIDNNIDLINFCEENKIDNSAFFFLIYQDSALCAWSSNEIIPAKQWKNHSRKTLQIDDKWVYVQRKTNAKTQYTGYLIIDNISKTDENTITINNPFTCNLKSDTLKEESKKEHYNIYNNSGELVFTLTFAKDLKKSVISTLFEITIWMIALTALFFSIINFLLQINIFSKNKNLLFLFLLTLFVISSVTVSNFLHFSSDLFSPIYYSSHYKSLGTLFFNSYLILLVSIFFMQFVDLRPFKQRSQKTKISLSSIFIISVLIVYIIVYKVITGITNDSVVVLKPEMIYQYDLFSIVAISSIIFILWSAFVVTYKSLNEIFLLLQNRKIFIFIIGIAVITSFLLLVFYFYVINKGTGLFIPSLMFLLLIIVTTIFILHQRKWQNLLFHCTIYLILSGIVLFTANQTVDEREKKYKESIAETILSIEDPFILSSFQDLADEIEKDTVLISLFDTEALSISDIRQYIIRKYTKRYAEDYRASIDITVDQKSSGKKVSFRRIGFGMSEYRINASISTKKRNYLGEIVIIFRMYISEQQSELEKTVRKEMSNYCYAGYENNMLTMSVNTKNISYLFNLSDYKLDELYSGMEFVSDNVTHTVFKHNEMVLLVSSEKRIIWDKISFLVILFLAQFIFSLIPMFLSNLYYNPQSLWRPGFQESIQLFVTTLVTLTVISTAFFFFRFFQIQRNDDLENIQSQASRRINRTITSSISKIDSLYDLSNIALRRINEELSYFYELDFLDLNIYDKKGENIERYGRGIYINTNINPLAVKALAANKTNAFIINEFHYGEEYKSIYETILNKKGEIIGYTNLLRYQNKQKYTIDYKQAQFLTKFMSICTIIIILIVISSIPFIQRLTRPLLKVTERLSKVKLGEELKEIKWNKNDEFGELVSTYNILIDRLQISAELLEKSSQEVAWKDMARQVAHEIKNPLTPIRLTTQQMLKELNKNNNINHEKLKYYFSMIIQQTDTLTDIATSFSNFAKINQREGHPEDLIPIIQNTLSSFSENQNALFYFKNNTDQEKVMSFVNKSQISQVFNNLIKNAIQAKKPEAIQSVSIEIENYGDKMWQIKITDTGIGMTPEVKERIFSLNFTTKTSGTGLGLAMVQRIITTWGGSISFESTHNVGTTFSITLPKHQNSVAAV